MAFPRLRLLPVAIAGAAVGWATLSTPQGPVDPVAPDHAQAPPPAAPAPAPATPVRKEARLWGKAAWGSSPGALGHDVPQEGSPQGPMGFTVDAAGRLHVLDTVNGRVTVLEAGRAGRSVALPSDTIDDLELLPDGGYVALDRHVAHALHLITPQGKERGRIELAGREIPRPGLATGLFVRNDELWVELSHAHLLRVGDVQGQPLPCGTVPGRFTADGQGLLSAERRLPSSVRVVLRTPSLQERELAAPSFPLPVALITALESQADGGVILGVILHRDRGEAPFDTLEARHLLVGLGPDGSERWRAEFPVDEGPEENLRPVRLGRDGSLYGMVFRKDGVEFWQVKP